MNKQELEDVLKKAKEQGRIDGYNTRDKELHEKTIEKEMFKQKFNGFLMNNSPLLFFGGILVCLAGIWVEPHTKIVWTGIITIVISIFIKLVEV